MKVLELYRGTDPRPARRYDRCKPCPGLMDTGDEDVLMLDRARVMTTMLDEAGIDYQLPVREGGHNYVYWVCNFEMYLKWLTKDW